MDFPEIPGYKISGPLGKGGMAVVYLAVQANFERQVALKIMAKHLLSDASFGERFLREARIVAQLSHQNIVPVYDVGQFEDFHYMAMEYLPEGDLKGKLKKGLPLSEGINIIKAIATGLDYAHKKNFIHRDIKPENILFREDGSPVISDFGIARNTESETRMTMTGTVIGSPHYMSPEQAEAAHLDGRTDLYSLGIIFYEMLSGAVPFSGESAISIGIKHITAELPPLPADMAEFQEFIDIALAKDREERFQTGAEFREALEEVSFGLSDVGAGTVVMTREELAMGSSAIGSKSRSGASRASKASRSSRPPAQRRTGSQSRLSASRRMEPQPAGMSKTAIALSFVAVASLGAVGAWYYTQVLNDPYNGPVQVTKSATPLSPKQQELLDNADNAIRDKRYYAPSGENAQYYLTTLLALSPELPEAKAAIENLFRIYLSQAQTAIASRKLGEANNFLNQSSQITFYIQNRKLLDEQRELRSSVIAAQQQQIIAGDRKDAVDALLTKADAALAADKLTSPAGENAYEYYQSIFELDASNQAAQKGIRAVADAFLGKATTLVKAKDYNQARTMVSAATQVLPTHDGLANALKNITDAETADLNALQAAEQEAYQAKLAEQEKARKERATKIAQLQAEIDEAIDANRLTLPEGSSALDKIRELQDLDPGNTGALKSLDNLVTKLAALAQSAISRQELDAAERHLKLAQQLSPTNPKVAEAQKALRAEKDRIAELLAIEKARQDSINKAIASAENRIESKNPIGALESLGKALEIDPKNSRAIKMRETVLNSVYRGVKDSIEANEFIVAEALLDGLSRNNASPEEVTRLRALLADEQAAAQFAASDEGKLLFRANELEGKNRTDAINTELRSIYKQLVKINPAERSYAAGLTKTSDTEAQYARSALSARKFEAVRSHLDIIKIATPAYPGIGALEEDLASVMRAQSQASDMLTHARAYIETPYQKPGLFGNNNDARKVYKSGYQAIVSARSIDEGHPELSKVFRELDSKYVSIIGIHMTDKDYDEAREFIDDYTSFQLAEPSAEFKAMRENYSTATGKGASDSASVASVEEAPAETAKAEEPAKAEPAKEEKKPKFIGGGF